MWCNDSIVRMRALGLLAEHELWALASEKVYSMFQKAYLENYRLDAAVSGYEWWLGFDWIAASNGIIGGNANNPRPKPGISNTTLQNLQANVMLLVKNPVALQSKGHRPGDFVPFEIQLSNWTFMGEPRWHGEDAQLSWSVVVVGGPTLNNGSTSLSGVSVAQGETGAVAVFGVDVPEVTTASKIRVEVNLHISGQPVAANEWRLSVFPPIVAKQCSAPVFAAPVLLDAVKRVCSNAVAVPPSLTSETSPFVLVRQGGLSEADVTALHRTGSFGVSLNPDSGDWPVCGQSSVGSVGVASVAFAQPWWMAGGTTGTLVYDTALTKLLGFTSEEIYLDHSWSALVNGGRAFTLDGLSAGVNSTVHIRAIPTDGAYGVGYETSIHDNALLWEGVIMDPTDTDKSDHGELPFHSAEQGRFLVSGLNLLSGSQLKGDPIGEHVFERLLSYAVSESANNRPNRSSGAPKSSRAPVAATAAAKPACNVSGSFCTVGSEETCQVETTSPNVCNTGYEIVSSVCLQEDAVLDAIYPRLLARTKGTRIIGVVYDTSQDVANQSFCSAASSSTPRQLVANGSATTLDTEDATWFRVPIQPTQLKAGVYWIGVLLDADVTCFGAVAPAGGRPAPSIGPGSHDAYVTRSFDEGPAEGSGLNWVHGAGGFAVYGATAPKVER